MPQISRINKLTSAATFTSYDATKHAPDIFAFGVRNLIYGFNGTGKTTISRVLEMLSTGTPPTGLPGTTKFEIVLDDGTVIRDDRNLQTLRGRVCVYNEDFVEKNFNWHEGTADPVQIGSRQVADVQQLEKLQTSVADLEAKSAKLTAAQQKAAAALDRFCRDTARSIEQAARLPSRSYQAPTLKRDYAGPLVDGDLLSDDDLSAAVASVGQAEPPRKIHQLPALPDLHSFATTELPTILSATASLSALSGFEGHEAERPWLERGFHYHRNNELGTCLLCDNPLTPDRLDALASFFSEAVNDISRATLVASAQLDDVERRFNSVNNLVPAVDALAPQLRTSYEPLHSSFAQLLEQVPAWMNPLRAAISQKSIAPATAVAFPDDEATGRAEWAAKIAQVHSDLVLKIEAHQNIVDQFAAEQERLRTAIKTRLLHDGQERYVTLTSEQEATERELKSTAQDLETVRKELAVLQAKMRDHSAAAEPINTAIANFLRHKQVIIQPVEKGYLLQRADGSPVVRLSEGEKTAITFCYFLASLGADNRKKRDLIVVIDDPISSLDTRALNYMAALIKTELAGVGQLFILTHNLSFMTEMRKWVAPAKLLRTASDAKKKTPPETVAIPLLRAPRQGGRAFRSMVATGSEAWWPAVPTHGDRVCGQRGVM